MPKGVIDELGRKNDKVILKKSHRGVSANELPSLLDNVKELSGDRDEIWEKFPEQVVRKMSRDKLKFLEEMLNSEEYQEVYKSKVISHLDVLTSNNNATIDSYIRAVIFVTHRMAGDGKVTAWAKANPDRWNRCKRANTGRKVIEFYAENYSKGKLVMQITEQALVPVWLSNYAVYQKAINTQAELMMTAKSEMVRMHAANSLMQHLAKPKEAAQINVQINNNNEIESLMGSIREMADMQRKLINKGTSAKEVIEGSTCIRTNSDESIESD